MIHKRRTRHIGTKREVGDQDVEDDDELPFCILLPPPENAVWVTVLVVVLVAVSVVVLFVVLVLVLVLVLVKVSVVIMVAVLVFVLVTMSVTVLVTDWTWVAASCGGWCAWSLSNSSASQLTCQCFFLPSLVSAS